MTLRKFWITFEKIERPNILNLGCGVTAHDEEDAIQLVRNVFHSNAERRELQSIVEFSNLSDLDQKHVVPNMADPALRGIWFPLGVQEQYVQEQ